MAERFYVWVNFVNAALGEDEGHLGQEPMPAVPCVGDFVWLQDEEGKSARSPWRVDRVEWWMPNVPREEGRMPHAVCFLWPAPAAAVPADAPKKE